MADTRVRLHGRERVVEYVRAALVRHGVPEQPSPIVLLAGSRGSGGSVLLDALWAQFAGDCLSVRLDLRSAQGVEDIVLAAVRGLGRRIAGIRAIDFPRTAMLLKALSFVDTGGGHTAFEAYLRARAQDAQTQSSLNDWANRAAPLLSPEQRGLLEALTGLLGALHSAVGKHRDNKALRWLAERGDGGREYDSLWELYRQHHGQDAPTGTPRVVARTLCAALLADLRSDFNDSWPRMQRPRNCLLLLDNAGGRTADLFLELLAECRRESAAAGERADPAVVVAVQRGRMRPEADRLLDPTDERLTFGVRHPLAPGGDGHPVWWYPVALADLNGEQVLALCTSSVLGRHNRDADFLYELTGGHPESTDRLAYLLARFGRTPPRDPRRPPAEVPEPFDPRRLLAGPLAADQALPDHWPPPSRADTTVEDYLLRRTLADHLTAAPDGTVAPEDNATLNTMAALAATPGLRRGACNAALHYLGWSGVDADSAQLRLTASMWLEETAEGEALRLHPLVELLLRHWLARNPETWRAVHTGYATHYSSRTDAPLRHHHTLAQVELARREPLTTVVGYLDEEYGRSTSSQAWLRVLDQVTAAPNRLRTDLDPRTFVASLAGPAEARNRRRAITRLTVARWLHGDRCFDPAHQLAHTIAKEYEHLAEITEDNELLYRQAGKFRRIENNWKD
ncbi:ATP-binding protein [Streptomyces sp. NBC_01198]|uniref:ATP-binding protein n=1 Tax=Streptomyces sp. NBC_01198 TaxID=2903769 RepID=UPI002E16500E|nr:ATP-binding protein [Streptomyces sp. NBC_01198]